MEKIRKHPRIFMAGTLLLIVVVLLSLSAAAVLAQPSGPVANYGMTWDVFASGGVTMSSAHFRMMSTAGQPLTAISTSANHSLKSGYWQGLQEVIRRVFVPMLYRDY